MRVAIPCEDANGPAARVSEHFGRCAAFALLEVDGDHARIVGYLSNEAFNSRGCLEVPAVLRGAGIEALVARRIGRRPLVGFLERNIQVYFGENAQTVAEVTDLLTHGRAQRFRRDQVCPGPSRHGGGRCP